MNAYDFAVVTQIDFIKDSAEKIQENLIRMKQNRIALVDLEKDLDELTRLKRVSHEVWHVTDLINKRCGLSLLITTTSKLTFLIIDIYWVYLRISQLHFHQFSGKSSVVSLVKMTKIINSFCVTHHHHHHYDHVKSISSSKHRNLSSSFAASILLCLPPLVSLIVIFTTSSSTMSEYNDNVAFFLHQLEYDGVDEVEELATLQRFSLQLLALKVQFRAKGFFEFTNSTLCEVSGCEWSSSNLISCKRYDIKLDLLDSEDFSKIFRVNCADSVKFQFSLNFR